MSSKWVDANGNQWRYSPLTGTWQARIEGMWVTTPLPSGGLKRTQVATSSEVLIVETMGPTGPAGPPGVCALVSEVLPAEQQDGSRDTFPLSNYADISQAIQVFRNGLMEVPGLGYLVTPTHVTFTTPPLDSDVLTVVYQKAQ